MTENAAPITPSTTPDAKTATPVVVKKYANRRLYNTESSSYITLDNLADMVRAGRDFIVYDARSGDDITRSVLTQIIVEEENKGHALLPTAFLRQLIGFYGDRFGGLMPRYLEQSFAAFARQQEQVRDAVDQTLGSILPAPIEGLRRQNVAIMERALNLFSPFKGDSGKPDLTPATMPMPPATEPPNAPGDSADDIAALRAENARLRQELAEQANASAKPANKAGAKPAAS